MNKCKAPKIPPLIINNRFLIDAKEKANEYIKYFSRQCTPLNNNSSLPHLSHLTEERLSHIPVTNNDILALIRSISKNKSSGPDELSMLSLCDDSIVLPLKLIFSYILSSGVYPDIWKQANVTPIHKKGSKQVTSNYRPISLLPICSKLFERIMFTYLYNHFVSNNLITSNQSGFRPGDSTINQLIDLVNDIHTSFDHRESLEVHAIFLDISKAFDKVWHECFVFKLKQDGITSDLLRLFKNYLHDRKQRVVLKSPYLENFLY